MQAPGILIMELNYNSPQLADGFGFACPHSAIIKSIITRVLFQLKKNRARTCDI